MPVARMHTPLFVTLDPTDGCLLLHPKYTSRGTECHNVTSSGSPWLVICWHDEVEQQKPGSQRDFHGGNSTFGMHHRIFKKNFSYANCQFPVVFFQQSLCDPHFS